MFFRYSGAVAQLGERLVRNEEAVGSIPISSTPNLTELEVMFIVRLQISPK